jgi:hypothetical protein
MKTKCSTVKVTSALLLALSSTASAQVLISDNFNTANTGINDDFATRQSGSLITGSTVNWLSGQNGVGASTQTISGNQPVTAIPEPSAFALTATIFVNDTIDPILRSSALI